MSKQSLDNTGSFNRFEPTDKEPGRYSDIERLTAGGMGVVYRAYDTILAKPVAIKTLIFDHLQEILVPRFQREAMVVSKLNHPNIVSILDFGISNQTEPYMVMDFVVGKNLEELVEEHGTQSIAEIVEIGRQICRGMAHAHSKGIIHRDLKPSNILIADQAEPGNNVRIVDFGIAKMNDAEPGANEQEGALTQVGTVVGSPLYMSPEQVRGEIIDERSDIYSLGCVLYFLATGKPPFRGETAFDTMQEHLNSAPRKPILEEEEELDTLSQLSSVILNCLAKDADERFSSMEQLGEALRECSTLKVNEEPEEKKYSGLIKTFSTWPVFCALGLIVLGIVFLPDLVDKIAASFSSSDQEQEREVPELVKASMKEYKNSKAKFSIRPISESMDQSFQMWKPLNTEYVSDEDTSYIFSRKFDRDLIKGINLQYTSVTDEGVKNLSNSALVYLNLANTKISDKSARYIKKLVHLETLILDDTKFGDAGLAELENPNIRDLRLDFCDQVTDKGLKTIVEKWPDLLGLDVSSCSATDKGIVVLGSLRQLEMINLNGLPVPDALVEQLAKAPLENISLVRSKISRKALNKLLEIPTLTKINAMSSVDDYKEWRRWAVKKYSPRVTIHDPRDIEEKVVPEKEKLPLFADFLDVKGIDE